MQHLPLKSGQWHRNGGVSDTECREKLARTYDGYHFSPESEGVYNPYSVLNAFDARDYANYWFETETPTFAIKKLQESDLTAEMLSDGVSCSDDDLRSYRAESRNPIPLLYQSGYLTIAGFDREFRIYSLQFPNTEVKYGFFRFLVPSVLAYKEDESPVSLQSMVIDLRKGDAESFLGRLRSLFASIPYPEHREGEKEYEETWRNQIFLVLKLLGVYVECEVHTSGGRADCVVQTDRYTYVFEFKLDRSAGEALEQIESKEYACRYEANGRRKVWKIGVNFDTQKRNLGEWKVEEI